MKVVKKVQTSDGKLHDSVEAARHHADVRYTNEMSRLAGKLVGIEKYTLVKDYLDEHLDEIVALKALRDDMKLEPEEDD